MDRPEDVEPNPVNGRVYVALTNNSRRKAEQVDGPNPRAENAHGQIVELVPPGEGADADHAATEFGWNMLLLAGDPAKEGSGAMYGEGSEAWFSSPDNVAIDPEGRLWIATDQGDAQAKNNIPDGMYCCDLEGAGRAVVKFFFASPGAPRCADRSSRRTAGPCSSHRSTRRAGRLRVDLRETREPLAGLPGRSAAAAVRGRDHQG